MKKILSVVFLASTLLACNDHDSNGVASPTDSTVHHTDAGANTHHSDKSASMMSGMNTMMSDMMKMESLGGTDHDFANLMKVHHLAAIQMAQLEATKGTDAQLKRMAQGMVTDQQREISAFDKFLTTSRPRGGDTAYFKTGMDIMHRMPMEADASGSLDVQFAQLMIPHHQSAVEMSEAYLKGGASDEVIIGLAKGIIASQQKEIGELKAWLSKNK